MDNEIRCPHCSGYYNSPVILSCSHLLCLPCACNLQEKHIGPKSQSVAESNGTVGHVPVALPTEGEVLDIDKLSLASDADSGVSSCSSRPTSLVSAAENCVDSSNHIQHGFIIKCPQCNVLTLTDHSGASGLKQFHVLSNIVEKYRAKQKVEILCQVCETGKDSQTDLRNCESQASKVATLFCDQCLIFYCSSCREQYHPSKGLLTSHWIVSSAEGYSLMKARRKEQASRCNMHPMEALSMYCTSCNVGLCILCLSNGCHHSHEIHALDAISKKNKTDLSQLLQSLSEKAKSKTQFIQELKNKIDDIQGECSSVEATVAAQIDALVEALTKRRSVLINYIRSQRDAKENALQQQIADYTQTLQATTGGIHFCIEALKESDAITFMEAKDILEDRVRALDRDLEYVMRSQPRVATSFDLTLDDKSLYKVIQRLTFLQLKAPGTPSLTPEECSAENNSIIVAWSPHIASFVEGYTLQIDDGGGGEFKDVYSGPETVCTIDGLHFNCIYRARVAAFNGCGHSGYSESLCLQTSELAWFEMEASHPDVTISELGMQVECDSYEHRVSRATVGFSRGTHYWQYTIQKYDGNTDIVFGVSCRNALTDVILGKCNLSWSMYIDAQRSWLMHGGEHFGRKSGGVKAGDIVGILLDCAASTLTFFVNKQEQASLVLTGVTGVLFPSVSMTRGIVLQLLPGLRPPE